MEGEEGAGIVLELHKKMTLTNKDTVAVAHAEKIKKQPQINNRKVEDKNKIVRF